MKKEKTVLFVTESELVSIVKENEDRNPVPFMSVTTDTESKLLLKSKEDGSINPYYGKVRKVTKRTYRLLTDYQKRVHNNRKKEGLNPTEFETEEIKGRVKVSKSVYTNHDGTEKYLGLEWFKEIKPQTKYFVEGREISVKDIEKFFPQKTESTKQGIENKVNIITPKFSNIVSIRLNGFEYVQTK
jgi:hypothetical protein